MFVLFNISYFSMASKSYNPKLGLQIGLKFTPLPRQVSNSPPLRMLKCQTDWNDHSLKEVLEYLRNSSC